MLVESVVVLITHMKGFIFIGIFVDIRFFSLSY
jgi:hypothetical protein